VMVFMINIGHRCGRKFCARYTVGILCVAFSLAIMRASAESPRVGMLGNGDRRVVEQLSAPWGAIGQINVTGYRRTIECTGSLIASNVVITAAHCIMDSWHQKPFPLDEIHFLAGVRRSKWLGHSTAKCLHFLPDYRYVGRSSNFPNLPLQDLTRRSFLRDIVLIVLNDDLNDIAPLDLDQAEVQNSDISLVHAAYPADRRYVLTAQFGCHVVSHNQELWFTDCDARPASSGGPVFIQRKEGLKLAAIMVGVIGTSSSVAVPIANWIDVFAERDCP
jgi:protease YdgD